MIEKQKPAQVFPLGEHLADEMRARGQDAAWLASRCPSLTESRVRDILTGGHARITLEEARDLARALGVNPALLLNLDRAYRRWAGCRKGD